MEDDVPENLGSRPRAYSQDNFRDSGDEINLLETKTFLTGSQAPRLGGHALSQYIGGQTYA